MLKHIRFRKALGGSDLQFSLPLVVVSPGGDDVAVILACCLDESGHYLLVDQLRKVVSISQHSGKWSATTMTRAVWLMDEVHNCLAWKGDHHEVTAVLM